MNKLERILLAGAVVAGLGLADKVYANSNVSQKDSVEKQEISQESLAENYFKQGNSYLAKANESKIGEDKKKLYMQAVTCFTQACGLEKKAEYFAGMGETCKKMGDITNPSQRNTIYGLALKYFSVASQEDPGNALYHFKLGELLALLGDEKEANLQFQQGVSISGNYDYLNELKKEYQELKEKETK